MKLFYRYKFSDKQQSLGGTISTIMGLAALGLLVYGVRQSFLVQGQAGVFVGSLALCSLLLSLVGCVIGLLSFKEENKFYSLSKLGSLLCGIITIFMVAVFMMGIPAM